MPSGKFPWGLFSGDLPAEKMPKCNTVVDFGVFHVVCCDLALDAEGQNRDFDQPSNVFGAFSFLLGPSICMFLIIGRCFLGLLLNGNVPKSVGTLDTEKEPKCSTVVDFRAFYELTVVTLVALG